MEGLRVPRARQDAGTRNPSIRFLRHKVCFELRTLAVVMNLTTDLRCIQCHEVDMTLNAPKVSCKMHHKMSSKFQAMLKTDNF